MSADLQPVAFEWDGESMVPVKRFTALADRQYVIGEHYVLTEHHERSAVTHRHYFACLREIWLNLPEALGERFPTELHLRKWALIQAGYADHRQLVASSKAEAARLAAFMQPSDQYAVIVVKNNVVDVFTPQSQSLRAMGKQKFAESKDRTLEVLSKLVGVTPEQIRQEAGRAA